MASLSSANTDLRYTLRTLRKIPVFTLTIVTVLALGIGLNTAMFSVLDALVWHALPYPQPNQLASLSQRLPTGEIADAASYPDFLDWRKNHSFELLAACSPQEVVLAGSAHPDRAFTEFVSPGYFRLLGLRPQLGRAFSPAEAESAAPLVLISHALWLTRFAQSPNVLGQVLDVNDKPLTIIGVLPADASGLFRQTALWLPIKIIGLVSSPELLTNRSAFLVQVVGRLKPGLTLAHANAEIQTIGRQLQLAYPDTNQGREVVVQSLFDTKAGPVKDVVLMLFASVTLVLLIACFNVANLVLSRYLQRQREFAIRLALGASYFHLLRQVLIETLTFSLLGAIAGLLLASACLRAVAAIQLSALENRAPVSFNWTTILYALAISLLGGFVLSLVPAVRFLFTRSAEALKSGERSGSSLWSSRLRDSLVFSQVVLATVLLIACGLMFRSLAHLYAIDPGFRSQDVVAVDLGAMPPSRYAEAGQLTAYYWRLLDRLQSIPTVQSAGASMRLPLNGPTPSIPFVIKGRHNAALSQKLLTVRYIAVSPDYLPALGVSLTGRSFAPRDLPTSQPVVIINEAIARRYWPSKSPIGDYLKTFDGEARWRLIVGVASDIRGDTLTSAAEPTVYVPFAQIPGMFSSILRNFPMSFVLRTPLSSVQLAPSVRQAIAQVDRGQVIIDIFPMRTLVTKSLQTPALYTQLLGLFGFGALLLASTGIYGVVSYAVIQRTRELGVRLALGASPRQILSGVLARGLAVVVPGALVGLFIAFLLTRLMASLLFGVSRTDSVTFVTVAISLTLVGLAASFLPALRAAYIDPKTALRQD